MRQVRRDHARLIDATVAGVSAEQFNDRMIGLETRRLQIETLL